MKASLAERLKWTAYLAWQWRGQSRFPFRPAAEISRAASRRVRRMVQHAHTTVPYYRDTMRRLGLHPDQFRNVDDLARLPVIEREALQADPEYFLSTAMPADHNMRILSGGTTASPRTVWWDTAAIFQNAAHAERERSIIAGIVGKFVNYRESVIGTPWGSDHTIQDIYSDRAVLPSRARIHYQYLDITESPEKNLQMLNEFKPHVIRSYGSYLARLFFFIASNNAEFHAPKVVFYDADELAEPARRLISEQFGIPVISAYQAVEAFKIGFECEEHSGLHLNRDVYPVRIVDGDGIDLPPGESGDVIVSNLANRATVLLNYRLGDVAHMLPEQCSCGRTLPLLSFIEGRIDDWVVLASGETIHPQAIRGIFNPEQGFRQYQVVQHDVGHFSVAITGGEYCADFESRVTERFVARFGPATRVEISYVDSLPVSTNGKFRPVISHVLGKRR